MPPGDTEGAPVDVVAPADDNTSEAVDVAPPFLVFIPQGVSTQASVGFQDSHMALLTPQAFWRIAPPKEACNHIAYQYKQVPFFGATIPAVVQAPPYSNTVKCFTNWNVCYSCGFNVEDGHTSMTCPYHLRKPSHDVNFSRRNAQQYINMGHPCSTHNRHKTTMPPSM